LGIVSIQRFCKANTESDRVVSEESLERLWAAFRSFIRKKFARRSPLTGRFMFVLLGRRLLEEVCGQVSFRSVREKFV
jgi:hypothetical protein